MKWTGASTEATAAYAARFEGRVAPGGFRPAFGLTVSSLGIGTYLGPADDAGDRAYREAVVAAVEGGINVVDTAVNYRHQRSERAIGAALRDLADRGFSRAQVVVATKGGYVPSPAPERYFEEEIVGRDLARGEDLVAGCHSIAPGYLRHQLDTSLANLGLAGVDVYYLHNPEQQLAEVPPAVFRSRMRAAFEELEAAVAAGKVGVYGTATWNGYRVPPDTGGALSLPDLLALAREVAGDGHHFRVVQLPFNLAMPEALTRATQSGDGGAVPLLQAAGERGVAVMTSASILQGRLARGLPHSAREALRGFTTDAQRAIQFARSAPGVTTALVGMGRAEHVRDNVSVLAQPPLSEDAFRAAFAGG
jgi:aryl-alcohol dehydrogenase-like predicted oxidoreductase